MGLREELLLKIDGDSTGARESVSGLANALRTSVKSMEDDVLRLSQTSKQLGLNAEQTRGLLSDQLAQYRQNGIVAPASLLNIERATQSATAATTAKGASLTSAFGSLSKFLGPLGVTFGVSSLVAFTKGLQANASEIKNTASKLDVSTEAVQRWTYALGQSEGTISDIDAALGFMNKKLGEGGDDTKDVLHDIGLEFETIRAMRPEQAFEEIVTAIRKLEDPMERARATAALFRSQNLLPAINAGIVELGNSAPIMAQKHIDAWDRMGNAAARYWAIVKEGIGSAGGELLLSAQEAFDAELRLKTVNAEIERMGKVAGMTRKELELLAAERLLQKTTVEGQEDEAEVQKEVLDQLNKMVLPRTTIAGLAAKTLAIDSAEYKLTIDQLKADIARMDAEDERAERAQKAAERKGKLDQELQERISKDHLARLETQEEHEAAMRKRLAAMSQEMDEERQDRADKAREKERERRNYFLTEETLRTGAVARERERLEGRIRDLTSSNSRARIMQLDDEWREQLDKFPELHRQIDGVYGKLRQRAVWDELLGSVSQLGNGLSAAGDMFESKILQNAGRALQTFNSIVSMVKDITSSISNITGLLGGGGAGGGGGNLLSGGLGLAKLFGFGGGGAATVGGIGTPIGITAPAGAGGAGGGLMGFLTNPWTIGIAAAGLGLWGLGKKLWGDAGSDSKQDFMNKNTWGEFGTGAHAFHQYLHKHLGDNPYQPGSGEQLWVKLQQVGKKDKAGAHAVQDQIIAALAAVGAAGGIQKFKYGGLDDFGPMGKLAWMHGREANIPLDKIGAFMNDVEKSAFANARGAAGMTVINNFDFSKAVIKDRETIDDLADAVARKMSQTFHQLYPVRA